ncbi:hypothetical protein [uncultured Clostridium sp.]|uniref:hypothetical protein n=1 Tax=uncultured Clostridium sp. TaxID=59620 RepID=UPI002629270C|nr:hypothetical protein [uncultured Clostridium sp.]
MTNEETIVVENTQRDAEPTQMKPNFDLLSTDATLNGNVEAPKEEIKKEVKTENTPAEIAETEIALDADKPTEEVKEVIAEEVKDVPVEDVLTLDDDSATEGEADSWVSYAKYEGLEISEDTPEAYITAKLAVETESLQKKLAEVDSKKMEDYFHDLDPRTRMQIELEKSGLTREQIEAPLNNIAKFKALTDVELYRADLEIRLPNADTDFIDKYVENATENGQVGLEATRIRLELDAEAQAIESNYQQIIEKYKANKDNFLAEKSKAESDSIVKALNEMSDFIGQPLAPETKKGLTERFNNGKYNQLMKDPIMQAKFIAFVELGDKAVKNIEAKSYNKGKLEIANKLHNTPPVITGGAGTNMTNTIEGNFERLENDAVLKGKN